MGENSRKILIVLVVILLIAVIFLSLLNFQLIQSINSLDETYPQNISDIKGPLRDKYLGRKVTVEGYFVIIGDDYPILIQDLDYLFMNSPLPEDQFLPLTDLDPKEFYEFEGGLTRVPGILTELEGELVLKINPEDLKPDPVAELRELLEKLRHIPPFRVKPVISTWQHNCSAILISGGANAQSAHLRYWNDLKMMYTLLVNNYSYAPERIIVLYKNGIGEDNDIPVNYSATVANLNRAFANVSNQISEFDSLFIFTTNHGGGFLLNDPDGRFLRGGQIDVNGDEPEAGYSEATFGVDFNSDGDMLDTIAVDEVLNLWGNTFITDDDFNTLLNTINCSRMIIVMEQCFSGGFIHDLSAEDRIIITAANETQFSWGADTEGNFDEFVFHFMTAVNITALVADSNSDRYISMTEAFNYASLSDSRDEEPWYDDNEDQIGSIANVPNGDDGDFGKYVTLWPPQTGFTYYPPYLYPYPF
jgi:hypothetical protein